jgi:hypothetical protein
MQVKTVLVLANSFRRGGRCIAGRELLATAGSRFGDWVRPISNQGEGELLLRHIRLGGGPPPRPLDVVRVPLTVPGSDPAHPEDWLVADEPWTRESPCSGAVMSSLIEHPTSLWHDPHRRSDRVSPALVASLPDHQSLYLVRPSNLRFRAWREFDAARQRERQRYRAIFDYGGIEYDLSLTDPVATDRFVPRLPSVGEPPQDFPCPLGERALLCVSLTPLFHGLHYKVVATVLETP